MVSPPDPCFIFEVVGRDQIDVDMQHANSVNENLPLLMTQILVTHSLLPPSKNPVLAK